MYPLSPDRIKNKLHNIFQDDNATANSWDIVNGYFYCDNTLFCEDLKDLLFWDCLYKSIIILG